MIDGAEKKLIIQVSYNGYTKRSYLHIYSRDEDLKIAQEVRKELLEYQVKRNFYRGGVLDSFASRDKQRVYHFLGNVNDYNNVWDDLILDKKLKEYTYFNTREFIENNVSLLPHWETSHLRLNNFF